VLLGRERECKQIDQLLADAQARRSASLVIRGDPGIGKSALLRFAEGRAAGMRVLGAIGVESELEVPFSGLHELLLPVLDLTDDLPDVQRGALRAALALGPPASGERLAVHAAVLAMLAEAAEESSLLCAIDDAHWLDSASAEAILFACRRLRAEGVLVLMTAREGERVRFDAPGIPELRLEGLDRAAAHSLLGRDGVDLSPDVAEQIVDMTQGNPLALIEVLRALGPEQRAGREPLAEPLPVGQDIERAFLGRVRDRSERTQAALVVAAAAGTLDLRPLASALEALGYDLTDLDEAEKAGLVATSEGKITFRHPLLRSAIYQTADPATRRSVHRAIAGALDDGRAESRAWHLAAGATRPDERVAAALEATAVSAQERGAPAVAAWSFARSASLTLDDEERARRLLAAGTAYWLAGRSEQALQQLATALNTTTDARRRADIQLLRGHALTWSSDVMEAHRMLIEEAERVAPIDRDRAAVMMGAAVIACGMSGQIARGVSTGRRAVELAADGPAQLFANVQLAINSAVNGDPQSHDVLIRSQQALEHATSPEAFQMSGVIAHVLMFLEEYELAQTMLDRLVAASDRGIRNSHPLAARAEVEFRLGRWVASFADAAEAVDLGLETGQLSMLPFCLVTLARVEAATGRDQDCRAHVAQALELLKPMGAESALSYAWAVLGLLELGRSRVEEAIQPLLHVAQHTELGHPNVLQWAPDLIESYVRAGRLGEAKAVLADLERDASRAGGTWAHAAAGRCRGLLTSDNEFDMEFADAIRLHDRTPTPFERARTELCYGERLRRVGRRIDARERLHSALATFESLGAEPWAEQARAQLRATGERVRKREESTAAKLTAQELQIAVLVAEGGTNREVGARLMLSPRTIEFHLRNIYAKVGVRSRTELARRVADKGANAISA